MLVGELLKKSAKLYGDRPFLFFHDSVSTYGRFNERVNRFARALQERGIGHGDRVALLMKNPPPFLEAFFAAAKIGAPAVTLNPRLHPEEYAYLLADSEPKALVLDEHFVPMVEAWKGRLHAPMSLVVLGERKGEIEAYEELIQESSGEEPQADIDENDPLQFIYSNGQSGYPRAAMLTHRNLSLVGLTILIGAHFYLPETRVLLSVPLFHIGPMVILMGVLWMGRSLNIKRDFVPQVVVTALSEENCTHTFLVPAMIKALLSVPNVEERDYSHFQYLIYGSAPMHEPILRRAMEVFRCRFIQGYGLTESTGVLGLLQPEDHETHWHATCRECLSAELRIVNEQGREVQTEDEVGEILAKGPGIMKGYWRSPEETKKVLSDGWLRTGDLARKDREGYITLVDRSKDMIIKGGENIYAAEIERVIALHPAVQRVGVFAVPDATWGEEMVALIERKEGEEATEKEIRQFLKGHLGSFKRPKTIEFRPSLPLLPDGRVDKRGIREEFWRGYEKRIH